MPRGVEMSRGQLTEWIDFQTPTGTAATGYATVAGYVPANIRSAGGNELLRFGTQVAVNAMVITVDYRRDVRTDWRISWPSENRTFQILSYGDETGRQQWLTIYASELL